MTRVYRLAVTYPGGSLEPGWEPLGWRAAPDETFGYDEREFCWPARRNYLTKGGADTAARVLRGYGAEVTIERSDPVTWPAAQAGEADNHTLIPGGGAA